MSEKPLPLFFLAYVFGLIASFIWLSFGETWQVFGDAVHYVSIYNGDLAPAPWGYRVMTPFLAKLFPWDIQTNFTFVSLNCLALTNGVLALYGRRVGLNLNGITILTLFWIFSYPFAYYSSTLIRADAPMLLTLALIILWSKYKVSALILLISITLGTFFHEMILIIIPALWLDKFFSGNLTGGRLYSNFELLIISLFPILIMIFTRANLMEVLLVSEESSITSSILEYTGGSLKHILRIYATYGPAIIFCMVFIATSQKSSIIIPVIGLFFITILATFLATDTLRVMSIIFLPIFLNATKFLINTNKQSNLNLILIFSLQMTYSFIVFGHLRTFEASVIMNIIAAGISFFALILSLISYKKTLSNN
tara:strand:- start:126 stop:1226 length:1101 start_codon:yes stop_codon:yes gene_type:complete